jgi:PAS domain S-box-containing protein
MIPSANIFKAKILIVDDQEANIMLLEDILREAGYSNITSTRAPFPVRELHRKNRYDLILLDVQMPGMDGFEVMEGLKEIETGAYLPVLVVTAQPDHRMRAVKAGAKDFISKPFDISELLHRVRTMLEVRLLHARLTGQDEAGRARFEEALRQSEEHFKLAARVLSDMVWEWNLLDQALWWSDGFLTPFGYAAGEIEPSLGSWTEAIHPGDRTRVMDGMRQALDGVAESWNAAYRFRNKDGGYSDVKDHGFILRDASGRAIRMVGGMRKVADRFGMRTVGLADDLNNALAPMLPAIEKLKSRMGEDDEGLHNLEILAGLLTSAGRSRELVDELLSLVGEFPAK